MKKNKIVVPDHYYDDTHLFDFGICMVPVFMFEDCGNDYFAVVDYDGTVLELYDDYDIICDEIDDWIQHMKKVYVDCGPDWFYRTKCDDEAKRQYCIKPFWKPDHENLEQRSAGDEVSLDQHIRLYQEVFHG